LIVATIPAGIVRQGVPRRIEATFKSLLFVGSRSSSRDRAVVDASPHRETARLPSWRAALGIGLGAVRRGAPWPSRVPVNGEALHCGRSSLR